LHATIHPPAIDEVPADRPVAAGFDHQITLYKPIDDTFIGLWNKVRRSANPIYLAQLQTQLSEALPAHLQCTEIQAVDLRVSQQWLRTMVWQLCVSQGFMAFKNPIEISQYLLSTIHQFSHQVMEVHGVELVSKKIFSNLSCHATSVPSPTLIWTLG
jgi:hypothetical protein